MAGMLSETTDTRTICDVLVVGGGPAGSATDALSTLLTVGRAANNAVLEQDVDGRWLVKGSPTDGATECFDISGDDHRGVFIPPGVAHGFAALTDVVMTYLVDNYYNPADELGVRYDDPVIGADWGVTDPILSARDEANPLRANLPADRRPYWPMRT